MNKYVHSRREGRKKRKLLLLPPEITSWLCWKQFFVSLELNFNDFIEQHCCEY